MQTRMIIRRAALSLLSGSAAICALAAAAPVASAQIESLNATYTQHALNLPGHPSGGLACSADFACGSGTAAGFGAFTTEFSFDDTCGCVVRTLTFADGSTLVLDENGPSFTAPGGSGSSHAPGTSEGHPGRYEWTWSFGSGTGIFAGVTGGSGTDDFLAAGLIASGTISGTLKTS
jgi:hypothetical protein